MEKSELPESWTELPFSDAVQRIRSTGLKIQAGEYKPVGRIPIVDQGQKLIAGFTDNEATKFQGPLPIIVFGDHTREVKFVDFDFAVGADGTVLLKPDARIEPRFFYCWLKSVTIHQLGYSRHAKLLAEQVVRFPASLAEQRRIVARVEALTRRLDQVRQARQTALAEAATVGHAVWDRAFADIPPEKWQPIGAHAKVQGGYAFKSEWFVADGIRLLRNQNVYHGDLDWTDTVYLPPSRRGEFKSFELVEGDIVITMDRPLIKSGLKAARVSKKDLPCLLLQRVGRFLCDDQLDKDYLLHFLFSQSFIPHISGDGRSCAVPHISPKQVEAIPIPLPLRREQRAIVARLDALRGKLDELQRLQREVAAELASFTPALLAKAFRGEL